MEVLMEKLEQARTLKREFRLREAIEYFNECAQIDPKCIFAAAQAGLCHLLLGEAESAVPFLEQAFNASSYTDTTVGAYLAAALTAAGREDDACAVRRKSREADPETELAEACMMTAEMLAEKKSFEGALRLIDVLSSVFAQDDWFKIPRNHYRIIRVLAAAGVVDVAEFLAHSLAEKTSDGWEGEAALSALAIAREEYAEAYEHTLKAIEKGGAADPLLAAQQHWLAINK